MARLSVIASLCLSSCSWLVFCGERPSTQQACEQGDAGACALFDEPAPLALVQSHAAGIAAKGAPGLSVLQQKELVGGGAGANTAAHSALKSSRRAPGAKVGGTPAAIWAATAGALVGLAAVLGASKGTDEGPVSPKYVSEFVGTFMLVFSVGCNVLVGDSTWGVVAIACTLMVSIYALGSVSGAHFNPAVSCAAAFCGKMPLKQCAAYICTQLAAGITAGLAYGLMLGETFSLGPADGFSAIEAGLAEIFYTFMLSFVVLNTAVASAHAGKDQFYGLAIGFSVVAGGYGAGSISGGCFNPAVALGIDSSASGQGGFGWSLAYFAFEVVGAALAALLFRLCRPTDFGGEEVQLGGRCLSEFLGTFMLVLTVGLNVLAASPAAVFSIAASLMCMIFALGSVSGAHFNPAVTFAVFLSGRDKIPFGEALAYIAAQVTGGVAAGLTYVAMQNGRSVALRPSASTSEALVGELAFTFLLSYVVLSVATVKSPLSQYFGLAIGSCVTAGGLAIGSLSGGSLNPAVSAGLAFSDLTNGGSLAWLPSYAAAELAGGAVAAAIFRNTHISEYASK
eukprot:CAMPEP_0171174758 /NCGR_PEP_ID=MMETSP0790-20130122/10888_1 /TAXON_ID=2925 /ORGANISM="Alexandrium catenella, Strain OF101" /LENGTH=566 /DNA_ID=CAMNT_0011639633 /DNA_START=90 /DNA_END=1790 /DNA_ORIENTATION=-